MKSLFAKLVEFLRFVFIPPHLRMTDEQRQRQFRECAVYALCRMGLDPESAHDLMYVVDKEDFWQQFGKAQDRIVAQYS